MFLAELRIENFRVFGEGDQALVLKLNRGLTALVGENDTGKTAVIDALRLALGTRDQEFFRVEEHDFHEPVDGRGRRSKIHLRCRFDELTDEELGAFVEYLTYEGGDESRVPVLYLNWTAAPSTKRLKRSRRYTMVEVRSGKSADGPQFVADVRAQLAATYLRPLRDAERAMSSGRRSRLSQVLQHTNQVVEVGRDYDQDDEELDPSELSVRGIGDFANALLSKHEAIRGAQLRLNTKYLERLSFAGSKLKGHISVSGSQNDEDARLRQLLEKLDLDLLGEGNTAVLNRGLGSNNLLFMACELLLLGSEGDGLPLLLIEEPEAHLHPQRQLQLTRFLQEQSGIQTIVTTHSPNLASAIPLENLVMLQGGRSFPLTPDHTKLDRSDYGFLSRFLDATKANLFFARGVLIVEGDAENILLPTLARLIGCDLTEHGVSIVNVGGIGLRRFARIYQRRQENEDPIDVPVACVADLDVMPDCAPGILGLQETAARRWRAKKDYPGEKLDEHRESIRAKAAGQRVETFVADEWTLEYDLAFSGLAKEVHLAAHLAKFDERIKEGKKLRKDVCKDAQTSFDKLSTGDLDEAEVASHVYALFTDSRVSKATSAQYFASILTRMVKAKKLTAEGVQELLPRYLVEAIKHVTHNGLPHEPASRDA